MGRFNKLRKNKQYGYTPRYYDDKGEGSPFKIRHKLDQFRTTVDSRGGIKTKLNRAMADRRRPGDKNLSLRLLIVLAVLIFIALYIIDFDLSIFFRS